MVWYGMVWYGMVWYGMVWYGMVWYGMVWYGVNAFTTQRNGTLQFECFLYEKSSDCCDFILFENKHFLCIYKKINVSYVYIRK